MDGVPASLLAAFISASGIITVAVFGAVTERSAGYFSAFAVGVLTVAVAFHLVPETLAHSSNGLMWIFAGFAAMVLIGIAVQASVNRSTESAALTFGYATIIGLAAHSFLDGVIYTAAFHDDAFTGWIATTGLLLHEFPEGVIAYFLLAQTGLMRRYALILSFAAAGGTTFAGAVAANLFIWVTFEPTMAAMLGLAAGALTYVLIVHLGPQAAKAPNYRGYLFAQLGVIVGAAAIIANMLSGGHHH